MAGTIFRFSGLVLVLLGSDQYSWITGQIQLSTSCNCSFLTSVDAMYILYYKRKNKSSLERLTTF